MSAGVCEVLAFEPDLRATYFLAEIASVVEGSGPAHVVGEEVGEFLPERFVFACGSVGLFELIERGHESFRDELTAVLAETSEFVGYVALDWWG